MRGNPAGTLADIVMLVRYALGQAETLEPLSSLTAGRFNLWLGREEKAGRSYTEAQREWLTAIRDHLAVNIEIRAEDLMDAPEFTARGGIVRARAMFGARLPALLDELTDTWWLDIYHLVDTNERRTMRAIAKLFTHGRSQAVRLPKEFRFEGKEVQISKIGDRVILEPIGEIKPMPWDLIDGLGDKPFMPEGRDQPTLPADRVVFEE